MDTFFLVSLNEDYENIVVWQRNKQQRAFPYGGHIFMNK